MNTHLWFINKKMFKIFHTGTFPTIYGKRSYVKPKEQPFNMLSNSTKTTRSSACLQTSSKDDSALNINASNHTPEDAKMATVVKLNLEFNLPATSSLGTVVAASKELNEFPQIFKRLTGRTAFLCQFSLSLQDLL